ncbi:histidine kinase [Nonomuraea sp. NPDC046570]|uniref:sensor histidine kinase n=1 Tax=Nonomuraea sp. NPDC046570 TaxID=3155255 RepID=UPI0033D880D0
MGESASPHTPFHVRHSARLLDVALALGTVVGVITGVAAAESHMSSRTDIPVALFLGAILLVRRRWPMAVLLLSVAAVFAYRLTDDFEGGWIWPASAAYFTAAATPLVRWVAAIGGAQLVYAAVDFWPVLGKTPSRFYVHILGEGLLLALLLAAGVAYAAALRWRGRLNQTDLRVRAAEERLQVSREVHDIVAHTLAVVGVHLNVAADALREAPDEAADALRTAQEVRNRAMTDLASLIGVLRDAPAGTVPQPDLASLGTLAEDARAAGLRVELREQGDRSAVPAAPAVAVHRIVQESLTNTLKHAGATAVEVTITYRANAVTVEIVDDGESAADASDGHGLVGMRERVSALGGTLTTGPAAGGYAVRAEIPVAGSTA